MDRCDFDVLIVGAGLSGIGAGYHLQKSCPNKTYAILEGRERLGGTWDFFRYPGLRSDSDMHTLGYAFRPWTNDKSIADGASILAYLNETASMYGIDKHIQFRQWVERASWSSQDARWTVQVRDGATKRLKTITCSFLFGCAGYYDYEQGHAPEFPGQATFKGRIVHPQKWTPDIEFAGKRVVVIGSGATAVTLVPEMAKTAAHVTMLQRSPTYIVSRPEKDAVANGLRKVLPDPWAHSLTRWKNVLMQMALYNFCQRYPKQAKKLLVWQAKRQLNGKADIEHFTPGYNPWTQRLCLVPDGDLFRAIRQDKASIVTGKIETFTETGIRLQSGQELPADLIVTATGLKLKLLGGIQVELDGKPFEAAKSLIYKGIMLSGVPNLAMAVGYSNASWTLKSDLACEYVCRLLNHMDKHGYKVSIPLAPDKPMKTVPVIDLMSGYIERAAGTLPTQGVEAPWKLHQNYVLDRKLIRHAPLADGVLQFKA